MSGADLRTSQTPKASARRMPTARNQAVMLIQTPRADDVNRARAHCNFIQRPRPTARKCRLCVLSRTLPVNTWVRPRPSAGGWQGLHRPRPPKPPRQCTGATARDSGWRRVWPHHPWAEAQRLSHAPPVTPNERAWRAQARRLRSYDAQSSGTALGKWVILRNQRISAASTASTRRRLGAHNWAPHKKHAITDACKFFCACTCSCTLRSMGGHTRREGGIALVRRVDVSESAREVARPMLDAPSPAPSHWLRRCHGLWRGHGQMGFAMMPWPAIPWPRRALADGLRPKPHVRNWTRPSSPQVCCRHPWPHHRHAPGNGARAPERGEGGTDTSAPPGTWRRRRRPAGTDARRVLAERGIFIRRREVG